MNIEFTYLRQQTKKYTFEQLELRTYVEKWCKGKVLNLFAGKTLLNIDEYRVDINFDMPADYHGKAIDFLEQTNLKFDTAILDPPFSLKQSHKRYNGNYIGSWKLIREKLLKVLNPGAYVISLGYNSLGMSEKLGFKKIAICLINHGGNRNDTICVVEEMYQKSLF
jgi:hypothetical protein